MNTRSQPEKANHPIIDTLSSLLMIIIIFGALFLGYMFMMNKASCVGIEGTHKLVCAFDFDNVFWGKTTGSPAVSK